VDDLNQYGHDDGQEKPRLTVLPSDSSGFFIVVPTMLPYTVAAGHQERGDDKQQHR
jgi:hypothetical protein